jgi:hypothetical protein
VSRRNLLQLDPDLAGLLPTHAAEDAAAQLVVPTITIAPGEWAAPDFWETAPIPMAAIVLSGLLARDVLLAGRTCRQLLAVGDPILAEQPAIGLLPTSIRWTVLEQTELALLDGDWSAAVERWPLLSTALLHRVGDQAERLAVHQAISQLPRVEDRVLALFLHLAERWGRMTRSGPVLALDLTHAEVGRLVGAKRPTVSLAITALAESGALTHRDDGWYMANELEAFVKTTPVIDARMPRRRMIGEFRADPAGPPPEIYDRVAHILAAIEGSVRPEREYAHHDDEDPEEGDGTGTG